MLLDVHAYVGNWPFRQLRYQDVPGVLALMDRASITWAVVAAADAVLHRNPQPANERLWEAIAAHPTARGRLLPAAVINPCYAGWQRDLARCHEELGMVAVRLFPQYHGYALSDPALAALLREAAARELPVQIPLRLEDRRQRHWLDTVPDLNPAEVAALARRQSDLTLFILGGAGFGDGQFLPRATGRGGVYVDVGRLDVILRREIPRLAAGVGVERLVFGSGLPFNYPEYAAIKVAVLAQEDPAAARAVGWENALRVFRVGDRPAARPGGRGVPASE